MSAITCPNSAKAAPIRQDVSRFPRSNPMDRSSYIMTSRTDMCIPAQRPTSDRCPPYCSEDHNGEPPGERSHWGIGSSVPLPQGMILLADVNARDGMQAEVVLHDSDGGELRLPPDLALMYGQAIISAAYASQAVSR